MTDYVEIRVVFPDPTSGRGRAVNELSLEVLDIYGAVIGQFALSEVTRVDSLLQGVVYIKEFPIDDPGVTPGTFVSSRATGKVGTQDVGPIEQVHWFEPQIADKARGVLLQWDPLFSPDPVMGSTYNLLYYEVERIDLRESTDDVQTQFTPGVSTLGFWPFDQDLLDKSTSPAHFNDVGTVGFGEGVINYAAEFLGYGHLDAGNPAKFQFAAGQDFSISLWVKPNPYNAGSPVVFGKFLDTTQKGYALLFNVINGVHYPVVYLGGFFSQITKASATQIECAWHHLVLAVDRDGEAALYIDGVKDTTFDASPLLNEVFDFYNLTVGANTNGDDPFLGSVDEVIVFNGCLTWLDVEKIYNEEKGESPVVLVGRSNICELVDATAPVNDLHNFQWRVYQVWTSGAQTTRTNLATLYPKDVGTIDAPLCLVEGRVRMPNDVFPGDAVAKFSVAPWDKGQVVHDRIIDRDEIVAPVDASGRFGAYLIQDAVVVCHIPVAHVKWRFVVPRQDQVKIQDLAIQSLKFRNNL